MLLPWSRPRKVKKPKGSTHITRWARLWLEELEQRCLLTGGNTTWAELGPSPQYDAQGFAGGVQQYEAGRVSALAVDGNQLFLGAAGGGVWVSDNYTATNPSWAPRTDSLGLQNDFSGLGAGLSDVGTIAVDPTVPDGGTIYAGTGEANYSADSRYGSGVLKSTDGGTSWALVSSGPGDAQGLAGGA